MEVDWSTRSSFVAVTTHRVAYLLAASTWVLLFLTAVMLWGRRLAGAFQQPFSPMMVVVVGGVLLLLAIGLRLPLYLDTDDPPRWATSVLLHGGSLILFLLGTLVTIPTTQPWWSWLLLWTTLVACEAIIHWSLPGPPKRFASRRAAAPNRTASTDRTESLPETVSQRFVRSTEAELGEIIQGQIRARFDSGQRIGQVHLSFCPPFSRPPQIEVETVDGPSASVRPSLIVPHGARIDVRLDDPAERDTNVLLDVFVHERQFADE